MQKFILTQETFFDVQRQTEAELFKFKADERSVIRAAMLLEEIFFRLCEHDTQINPQATLEIRRQWGNINLRLILTGNEYNPLEADHILKENDADYFRDIMIKAYRSWLGYSYRNGCNVVSITVQKSKSTQVRRTIAAMVAGVLIGFLMKETLPADTVIFFDEYISGTVRTIFLNALNLMIAPLVFFSIMKGLGNISDTSDLERLGAKMLGLYTATTIIAAGIALAVGMIFFGGEIIQIGTATNSVHNDFSLLNTFIGIVPKTLIDPLLTGNMMQIIFMAIIFGVTLNSLGEKKYPVVNLVQSLDALSLRVTRNIVRLIPLVAFLSMASLIFNVGFDSLLIFGLGIIAQGVMLFVILVIYGVWIMSIGRLSPVSFWKKIFPFLPIPAALASTNAAMPEALKFCVQKLGIDEKLSAFTIPIGASIKMDGSCTFFILQSIMFAKLYGVELTGGLLTMIFLMSITLAMCSPGVTGGAVICLTLIFTSMGIPLEAAGMALSIDPLVSMLRTPLNTASGIAATLILAGNENLINKDTYVKN